MKHIIIMEDESWIYVYDPEAIDQASEYYVEAKRA